MKKLLLLPLFFFIFLAACDKEDTPQPADTAKEIIKGNWTLTSITRRYYDESKNQVYHYTEDYGWYYDFDGKHIKIIIPSEEDVKPASYNETFVEEYIVVKENDKDYLYHMHNGNKENPIEITGFSDSRMVWTQHDWIPTYFDGISEVTADSAVQIFKFVRRK